LGKRIFGWGLALLAILVVLEMDFGRFGLTFDQARQYAAAKQFSEGNGLIKPLVNLDDLSEPIYEVHSEFPPALALISSLFFNISENIHVIQTVLSILTQILFLFLLWRLIRIILDGKKWTIWHSVFLLFLALNGQLLLSGGSSDLICVILYLGSAISLLNYHKSENKWWLLGLACFLNVITLYFRYAYLPALFVLPVYFVFRNLLFNSKEWKNVMKSMLFTVLFALPVIIHIYLINLQADHVGEKTSDWSVFYWDNLIQASPFPFHSFFELFPILKALGYPSDFGYDRGYIYPNWIHFGFYFFSIIILLPLIKFYISGFKKDVVSVKIPYALYSLVYSLGLIGLIYLGSVTNPSQLTEYNWSWAKVFRYYILVALFLHVSYFLVVQESDGLLKKFGKLLLLSSLFFSLALKAYNYTANYIPFAFEHNTKVLRSNDALLNSFNLHKELISLGDYEKPFVVLINSDDLKYFSMVSEMVQISNGTLLIQEGEINLNELNTTSAVNLLVVKEKSSESNRTTVLTSEDHGNLILEKTVLMP
jgi:hypothetical protein